MSADIDSVQIKIKRRRFWAGSLLSWTVWLENENVGKLRVRGSREFRASPGPHAIAVRQRTLFTTNSRALCFQAEAGDQVELVAEAAGISGEVKIWRLELVEGTRYEKLLGKETRSIDNSRSGASTTRMMSFTREWASTYTLSVEQSGTVGGSAGLGTHVLPLKAEANRTLKSTYSVTSEERKAFVEQVTINVDPRTRSEINFFWKEIRQRGVVRLSGLDFEVEVPYEIAVALTFDQEQVDISS